MNRKTTTAPWVLLALMLGFQIHEIRAEDVFWVNDAGGNWGTASNWNIGTLPGEQDAVFIVQPGSYAVNLDVAASISSLTVGDGLDAQKLNVSGQSIDVSTEALVRTNAVLDLNGGSVSGAGAITIEGELNWSNGTLAGTSPITIASGATLNLPGPFDTRLNRPLDNHGTIEWTGGHLYVGAVTLQNLGDGVFHAAAPDRQIIKNADEAQLDNHGTFEIDTTSTVHLSSGIPFNNHGTLNLVQGILQNKGPINNDGHIEVDPGTTLALHETLTQTATGILTGAGDVQFTGQTHTLEGAYTVTGTTLVTTTVNFNNPTTFVGPVNLSGTLGGSAPITIEGELNWSNGTLAGTPPITIASGATLNMPTSFDKHLNRPLDNHGTIEWTGGHLYVGAVTLQNLGDGVFHAAAPDRQIIKNADEAQLDNHGTFQVDTTATIRLSSGIPFNNYSTLKLTQGILQNDGTLNNDGRIEVDLGSILSLPRTLTQTATGILTGAGDVQFTGQTHTLEGTYTVTGTTLVTTTVNFDNPTAFTGPVNLTGTLGGSSPITIEGELNWNNGTLAGPSPLTIASGATLNMPTSFDKHLNRPLDNHGTIEWTGGHLYVGAVTLQNLGDGVFHAAAPDRQIIKNADEAQLDNHGTFQVDTTATIRLSSGIPFNNYSTLKLTQGILQNDGTLNNDGRIEVDLGSTLSLPRTLTQTATGILTGAGDVQFTGQTHTLEGTYTVTGTTLVTTTVNFDNPTTFVGPVNLSGTLGGSAPITIEGELNWSNGTLAGTSPITIASGATLNLPGPFDTRLNRPLDNHGTIEWTGGHLYVGAVTLQNLGDGVFHAAAPDRQIIKNADEAQLDNHGTFQVDTTATIRLSSGIPFNNYSTLKLTQGILQNDGTLNNDGRIEVDLGSTLSLPRTLTQTATGILTGAGDVQFTGQTHTLEGTYTVTGTTLVTTTVNFDNPTTFVGPVNLSGTLGGSAPITIEGELNWSNGTLAGTSPITIASGATLNLPGPFDTRLNRPLDNHGTIEWTGGHLYVGAVTLQNLGDGVFHAAAPDRQIIKNADEAQLDNHGTFQVDTTATIRLSSGIPFNNYSTLKLTQGILQNDGTLNNDGRIEVDLGSTLSLPRTLTQTATGILTGAGDVQFTGQTHTLEGTYTVTGTTLVTTTVNFDNPTTFVGPVNLSGTLGGSAPITIEGELNWSNGTLAGTSPITIASGATLNLPGPFDTRLNRPLDNHGTIEWTGGHLYVGAVTLQNLGDGVFHAAAPDRQIIKNADEAQLDNHGTFQVDTTATIRLSSGIPFNNHGVVGGQGLFDITGAQYSNAGEYTPGVPFGSLSIRGTVSIEQDKTLVIQLAGTTTGVNYDQLKVLGHATWRGTLAIELADGFRPQAGDVFTVLEFNSNTGFFDRITGLNLGPQLYLVTDFTPTSLILTTVDSRPRPVLSCSRSATEGAVDFQVTSIAGQDIILWTTTSLTPLPVWAPVLTNYDCGAVFDFIDLEARSISTQFYSVELLPGD